MNGVDVTDVTRNFNADDWDKLRAVSGHTYVYQRCEYLNGSTGRGGRDNRSGRGNTRGGHGGDRGARSPATGEDRGIAATNVTAIVEYDASASTIASHFSSSTNDHGGRSGGWFGPRRND